MVVIVPCLWKRGTAFSGSRRKIPYRKRCWQMIEMCAYTYTGKQRSGEQAQARGHGVLQWTGQLKARKVNSPLELITVIVRLCFIFILIWVCLSYHFLPGHSVLLSVWRQENCSFHVRAIHSPTFVFFRKLVAPVPLTGVLCLISFL